MNSTDENARVRRRRPRTVIQWIGFIAKVLLVAFLLFLTLAYWAYQSAQTLPDYYQKALEIEPQKLAESGARFEQRVLDLQSSARDRGEWQVVFTEDQINGWIAVDMPKKFPELRSKEFDKPRVSIAPSDLKVVVKVQTKWLKGIVVAKLDAFCTEKANEVAVQIKSIKSGFVSIPFKKVADEISKQLKKSDIELRWSEHEGDPVALISLPSSVTNQMEGRVVVLKSIEIGDGEIGLAGETKTIE